MAWLEPKPWMLLFLEVIFRSEVGYLERMVTEGYGSDAFRILQRLQR